MSRLTEFAPLDPLYIHGVVGPSDEGRITAEQTLGRMIASPVLEALCPFENTNPGPGELWIRVLPLTHTSPSFRSRVISFDFSTARLGSLVILYAGHPVATASGEAVDGARTAVDANAAEGATAAATIALMATAPSLTYYADTSPELGDREAMGELRAFARRALAMQDRCGAATVTHGRCMLHDTGVLRYVAAAAIEGMAPMPVSYEDLQRPTLGMLAVAVTTPVDQATLPPGLVEAYNLTNVLHHSAVASELRAQFAGLSMFDLGVGGASYGLVEGMIGRAAFSRWSSLPFLLHQVYGFIPPLFGPPDPLDGHIDDAGVSRALTTMLDHITAAVDVVQATQ